MFVSTSKYVRMYLLLGNGLKKFPTKKFTVSMRLIKPEGVERLHELKLPFHVDRFQ